MKDRIKSMMSHGITGLERVKQSQNILKITAYWFANYLHMKYNLKEIIHEASEISTQVHLFLKFTHLVLGMSASSRSCPNTQLSYNIQQK
jgi:hypothetical protein